MKAKKTEHAWYFMGSRDTRSRIVYDINELYLELFGEAIRMRSKGNLNSVFNFDFYKCK